MRVKVTFSLGIIQVYGLQSGDFYRAASLICGLRGALHDASAARPIWEP